MVDDECLFIAAGDELHPTDWAVGPWSPDTLQASAYAGLLVRALERAPAAAGMVIGRLGFDLWRPVTRDPLTTAVTVLREGRKARTLEASLLQGGRSVARCTAVFLKADAGAKVSDVKANIENRTRQVDAKVAAGDADWAEADAAEALDFADWAVESAQLTILDAIHARAHAVKLADAADNS